MASANADESTSTSTSTMHSHSHSHSHPRNHILVHVHNPFASDIAALCSEADVNLKWNTLATSAKTGNFEPEFSAAVSFYPLSSPINCASASVSPHISPNTMQNTAAVSRFNPFDIAAQPIEAGPEHVPSAGPMSGNPFAAPQLSSPEEEDDSFNQFSTKIKKTHIVDRPVVTDSVVVPALPPPPKPVVDPAERDKRFNPFNNENTQNEHNFNLDEIEFDAKFEPEFEFPTPAPASASAPATDVTDENGTGTGAGVPAASTNPFASAANDDAAWQVTDTVPEAAPEEQVAPVEEHFDPFHPLDEQPTVWRFLLRFPDKKKVGLGGSRWWKEVVVRFVQKTPERPPLILVFVSETDPRPMAEIPLEPSMQMSREKLQQYDQFGKLHTVKLLGVVYREMVGMKVEKLLSFKNLQNLITKPKTKNVLDHIANETEIVKFGCFDQHSLRTFIWTIEDELMRIDCHRITSQAYTKEELYCYVRDEYEAVCDRNCRITTHKARVRVFFIAFVTGMPICELGMNDKRRMGKEIVRRQDILPVMHDDWIDIWQPEFHSTVELDEFDRTKSMRFQPLDGVKFELVRFRVSLRENRELPLQCKCMFGIDGQTVSIRCDLIVPGFYSRNVKVGQVPCQKIEIRIPIPEEWINLFRTEKTFKPIASIHSVTKKPGKVKGLDRISQIAQNVLKTNLLEVDCGLAKYEHLYRAIVWRIPKLPDGDEGLYKTHLLQCCFQLGPHDPCPPIEKLRNVIQIEYQMPSSTISGTTIRSIAIEHPTPPEKWVRYKAKFAYTVEIDYHFGALHESGAMTGLFNQSEIDSINANQNIFTSYNEQTVQSGLYGLPVAPPTNADSTDYYYGASTASAATNPFFTPAPAPAPEPAPATSHVFSPASINTNEFSASAYNGSSQNQSQAY